jgi:Cu/Ag efflux pump CusA
MVRYFPSCNGLFPRAPALVPIALGMGKPGSEIQAPMTIVIFFGLLTSTALNMVVIPAAYYRFRRPG